MPQAGRVFFIVEEASGGFELSPYVLYQRVISADAVWAEIEPNNSCASAVALGGAAVLGAVAPADVDCNSVAGTAGQSIVAIVDNDPEADGALTHTVIEILDTDGTGVLAATDDGGATDSNAVGPVPTTATFFVRVSNGGQGADESYRLLVSNRHHGNLIFADGFSSGDTSAWSTTTPSELP